MISTGDINNFKSHFNGLSGSTPDVTTVETDARRYLHAKSMKYGLYKNNIRELPSNTEDTRLLIEEFAISQYQENPLVNLYTKEAYFPQGASNEAIRRLTLDQLRDIQSQGVLMQSYIKRNPITNPSSDSVTVTRYESNSFVDRYQHIGEVIETKSFMSTSRGTRLDVTGNNIVEDFPRVITVELKQSGADISAIHPDYTGQREVLLPFGTQLRVVSRTPGTERGVPVMRIHLEEVVNLKRGAGDAGEGGSGASRRRTSSGGGASGSR